MKKCINFREMAYRSSDEDESEAYRSSDEDESESDPGSESDESVAANSVESDKTPSPSILGGLELLLSKRTTKSTNFDSGKLSSHKTLDEEMKQIHSASPSDKGFVSCSQNVTSHQIPFVEAHSPVFTPPRTVFTPSLIRCSDKDEPSPVAWLSAASNLGATCDLDIPPPEGPDAHSQALFSSNQSSCPSLDNIIHNIVQTGDKNNNRADLQYSGLLLTQVGEGGSLSGDSVKSKEVTIEPTDEDAHYSRSSPGRHDVAKVTAGSKPVDTVILPTIDRLNENGLQKESISFGLLSQTKNLGNDDQKEEKNVLGKSDGDKLTAENLQSSEKLPTKSVDLGTDEVLKDKDAATSEGYRSSLADDDADQAVISREKSNLSSHSSKPDETNEFDHLSEEYKKIGAALIQPADNHSILSNLKEKLTTLKDKMKTEAYSLKEKRGKILSHYQDTTASSHINETSKAEELLDLSIKQKQILSLLTIHKDLSATLSSKMLETKVSTEEKAKERDERCTRSEEEEGSCTAADSRESSSSYPVKRKLTFSHDATADRDETLTNLTWLGTGHGSNERLSKGKINASKRMMYSYYSQPKPTRSMKVATPTLHLTLKDLIDEGVIAPGKSCLSIPDKDGTIKAELLADGSILSQNVWYKTEREWYARYIDQPITTVKRPKLWNLMRYKGEQLNNLACQCQVLHMAKIINPTQRASSVTKQPIPAKSVSQRQSFYDSIDLSSIKSIYLIGNEELFPEEEMFQDGFWKKDGVMVPTSWLNDLTRWEE